MAKQKSSQSPATSPEMDPVVWSQLPEDLLERVLSFLPLKTFLTLRSTCKHFKSLVCSPSFISKHSSSSSSSSCISSFLLLCNPYFHRCFPLYDTAVSAWRDSPLSLTLSPLLSCAPSFLLSISHGLLCFSLPKSSSFLVCNLFARSSRIVSFPTQPFQFELLTLVSTGDKFRLFMLSPSSSSSSGSSSNSAFVYDSGLNLWRQFGRVDSSLGDNYLQEGVFFNGRLYFTSPEPFSIVGFDLESGEWGTPTTMEVPPLGAELTFLRLASDGDEKLYLIGGVGENGISRSMKVWELDRGDGGGKWVEIGSVPQMMCRKLKSVCYHNYEHVYCFWHQGLICICCYNWPEILYCKVSRRTWHWLPKCPSLPEKWSCGFRWFSLVPELHAFL